MFFQTVLVSALVAASGTHAVATPGGVLESRVVFPNPSVNCHDDQTLVVSDYKKAASQLGSMCDSGTTVKKNSVFYETFGTSMAFVCNWGRGSQECPSGEIDEAIKLINAKCGTDKAGWVQIDPWAKQYGRATTDDHPCPNLSG